MRRIMLRGYHAPRTILFGGLLLLPLVWWTVGTRLTDPQGVWEGVWWTGMALLAVVPLLFWARIASGPPRKASATFVTSLLLLLSLAVAMQLPLVGASPDSFYLSGAPAGGVSPSGQTMDTTVGSNEVTLAFDTGGQDAYWYSADSYPTQGSETTLQAGAYTFGMYFDELPRSWWDDNYTYRRQLTVAAGSSSIPSGYPVRIAFDHASLVSQGKAQAGGDDVRVVFWNGTAWTELSRVVANGSAWNDNATTLFFETQASIAASGSDTNYFLHYGYGSAASPPTSGVPSARFFLVESLGETQTSSTTYSSKVQLAFTPGDASEHWVVVATWRQRHVGGAGVENYLGDAQIRINGVARTGTDFIGYKQSGDAWMARSALFKLTGNASQQTVDLDFRAMGGTDGIDSARILAFLIPDASNADIQYAETLGVSTDTAVPTWAQNLTFTPSSAGDYLWMANGLHHEGPGGGSNGGLEARDETGTVSQLSEETYMDSGQPFQTLTEFEVRTLAASSQTFSFVHLPDTAGSDRKALTQLLFRTDVFDTVETSSSEGESTTTQTTYQQKNSLTTGSVSSPQDFVYLVVTGLDHSSTDINNAAMTETRLNTTQQIEAAQQINRGSYMTSVAWAYGENVAGNRVIDQRWRTTISTLTSRTQYAQIVSLRYKEAAITLGSEGTESNVKITVDAYHTKTDGTNPQEIVTSSTVTVDNTTSNPLFVSVGSGSPITFSSSDPRLIRVHINVAAANGGARFVLAYNSTANPTNLLTPAIGSLPRLTNPTLNPTSGTPSTPFNFTVDYSHPDGTPADVVKVNVSDAAAAIYNNFTLSPTQTPEVDAYVSNQWALNGTVNNFANMQADQGSYATLVQETVGSEPPPPPPDPPSILEVNATGTTTTTSTSYTLMNSMSITPGAGDYLAVFSTSVSDSTANTFIRISLFVNGAQLTHTEREQYQESSIAGTPVAIATHAHVTVGASQAVEVRWLVTGGTGTAYARTLNLFPVDSADVSEANATSDDSTSSASYIQLGSMTLTPGAGDYLLLFSTSAQSSSTSNPVMAFAVYVNGAIVQHTERVVLEESSIPDSSLPVFIAAKVSPGASQAVEIRWAVQAGSGTIVAHERTLTLFQTDGANILQASATSDASATNTADALLDSMSLTPGAGEYLALFSESHRYGTLGVNPNTYYSLYVNGAQISHTEHISGHEGSLDNTDLAAMTNGIVSPGSGESVEVQWRSSEVDSRTAHERTLVLVRTGSGGAIVLDNVSSANGTTSPLTFSHSIGSGANRLLAVTIAVEGAPASADITAVTYNSVSLTKAIDHNVGTGTDMNLEIWYMLNASLPSTGSYTVSITTASTITDIIAGAISVTGAAQKGPEATASSDDGGAGDEWIETQITVPTDDSWIFDVVGIGDAGRTFTANSGQAEAYDVGGSSSASAAGTTAVQTAGTQTLNWTVNGGAVTTRIAHALASFAPAYSVGGMELDNVSSGNTTTSPLTFSHTLGGGSNRLLVVLVGVEAPLGNSTIGGVTYNGATMTLAVQNLTGTSYDKRTAIYYLLDAALPSAGTYTVSIGATLADEIQAGAISMTGAAQQGPEATATNDDGEAGNQAIETQITTATNNSWVFDVVGTGNEVTFTPNSGQIEWFELQGHSTGSTTAGAYRKVSTAGSEVLNWTTSGSNRLSQSLAAFAPASASSTLLVQFNTTGVRTEGENSLVLRYNLTTANDAFGLWVWNFTASGWTARGTLDQTTVGFLNVTLKSEEVGSGVVRLRLNDTSTAGDTHLSIHHQLVHNSLWRTGVTFYYNTTLSSGNYSHFFWANTTSGISNKTATLPGPLVNAEPSISNFRLVNATGVSMVGQQLDVGVPYFFLFNVTDDDGWGDIAQDGTAALRLWYDGNQTSELTFDEQTMGANYRILLQYADTADPGNASLSEWSVVEGNAGYNASASTLTEITSTSAPPASNWYDTNWSYRKNITIDSAKVSADLVNFPVLVRLTDTGLRDHAQPDGDDILFTMGATKLSHEIETYNGTTGELVAWVNVTSLSSSADTEIYMYYGNSSATNQQDPANVWDSNFKGVWHLKEDPSGAAPQMMDSTSNSNDGSSGGMVAGNQVDGWVDGSLDFDGSNDRVNIPEIGDGFASITVSAWIKVDTWPNTDTPIVARDKTGGTTVDDIYALLAREGSSQVSFRIYTQPSQTQIKATASALALDTWYYLVGTYDGSTVRLYINGSQAGSNSGSGVLWSGASDVVLGDYSDAPTAYPHDGIIDEVRISNASRSVDWISTEYNNQFSPSTFYAVGSQESAPQGSSTLIGYEFNLSVVLNHQVKQANDPTNSTAGGYNDQNSWNAEVRADDGTGNATLQTASTGEHLEFGVYQYTFVNISASWTVTVDPGASGATNSVTVYYRSNDDFRMLVWFTSHLVGPETVDISNVEILAAADPNDNITSDTAFGGLGIANATYIFGSSTWWYTHATGTNEDTVVVQFRVTIPVGTLPGTYTAQLTIRVLQRPA